MYSYLGSFSVFEMDKRAQKEPTPAKERKRSNFSLPKAGCMADVETKGRVSKHISH